MTEEGETSAWLESEGGERISLQGICTFGRIQGNTVVLSTPKVSRRHAMIHEQDNEFWLVDLGSTNGIAVNEDRVTHPVRLQEDDRIQMPDNLWKFKLLVKDAPTPKPRRAFIISSGQGAAVTNNGALSVNYSGAPNTVTPISYTTISGQAVTITNSGSLSDITTDIRAPVRDCISRIPQSPMHWRNSRPSRSKSCAISLSMAQDFTVGALFDYAHTGADLDGNGSKATVDSYSPGVYASYVDKGWYGNAMLMYGFNSNTDDRQITIPGIQGVNHALRMVDR